MGKFYFFISTEEDDVVTRFNVFTTSVFKAYTYAFKYFKRYNCKGHPTLLAI